MRRTLFTPDHDAFRSLLTDFIDAEVVPHFDQWERAGEVPRSLYTRLGELGVLGIAIPERFGGAGIEDFRYNIVLHEVAAAAYVTLGTLRTHLDIVLPYFLRLCDDSQQQRWFPGLASGAHFAALALTEPNTGSDLAGVRNDGGARR